MLVDSWVIGTPTLRADAHTTLDLPRPYTPCANPHRIETCTDRTFGYKQRRLFICCSKNCRGTPEQIVARRLSNARPASGATPGQRILIMSMRDWAVDFNLSIATVMPSSSVERRSHISHVRRRPGHLSGGPRQHVEGPPMPCTSCTKYVSDSLRAHGRDLNPLTAFGPAAPWPELDAMSLDELHAVGYAGLDLGDSSRYRPSGSCSPTRTG